MALMPLVRDAVDATDQAVANEVGTIGSFGITDYRVFRDAYGWGKHSAVCFGIILQSLTDELKDAVATDQLA